MFVVAYFVLSKQLPPEGGTWKLVYAKRTVQNGFGEDEQGNVKKLV